MGHSVDDDPELSFDCFRDFVVGYTIREISKRHRLDAAAAEARVRRGLYDFGFSDAVLKTLAPDRPE
jgi:hypothetical protein